ncbi:16S rRNA (guanine(966)-N(2))-methyltransferase RsmD [Branchiibius sp. NY16-3462-2]|uniref:16S rRNA (guanine(966)-N(2))-methyltransferase RsmD n=1 Tax=Branchiibius sp. NY16-3462-2 TaxID=1807500 RepID=UPI00079C2343|nr:16S rRNA (guanine(966)-N(2))-methyltransferase RsmD [Branchiibius sp. NY16-3462-2]KYH43303.1 16S rRNA (guanine(966)-N(2))-methyltransferase RsmD [Branchiibius sp. NY16-3462-2]
MTRIIAGTAGGRRLQTPAGSGTRPTSDRVREALFARLEHLGALDGGAVDLYAGSGALGLEAASRGAAPVLLVESDRRAAAVIKTNVAALGLRDITVRAATVERTLAGGAPYAADLVLIDPPYAVGEEALAGVLEALTHGWLADEATVVVERSSRTPQPTWPAGLTCEDERKYGETTLWFARFAGIGSGL